MMDETYPPTINPVLFAFDEYGTYDLILCPIWKTIRETIKKLIGWDYPQTLNTHNLFFPYGDSREYLLIERFTPFEMFLEDYSTKIFNFLLQFAGTQIKDDDYFSGANYPKNPIDYSLIIDSFTKIYDEETDWNILKLIIPITENQESIKLKWLRYGFVGGEGYGTEYLKTIKFLLTEKKEQTIEINLNYIQPCSLIIETSDPELYDVIKLQIPKIYLYENIDFVLNSISETIFSIPYLNQFLYQFKIDGSIKLKIGRIALDFYETIGHLSELSFEYLPLDEFNFVDIPISLKQGALIYANNNHWGQANPPNDIGHIYIYNFLEYNNIPEIDDFNINFQDFYKNKWGIDLQTIFDDLLPLNGYERLYKDPLPPYGNYGFFSLHLLSQNINKYNIDWMFSPFMAQNYHSSWLYKRNFLNGYLAKSLKYSYHIGFCSTPIIIGHFGYNWENNQIFKIYLADGVTNENGDLINIQNGQIQQWTDSTNIQNNSGWIIDIPLELNYQFDLIQRNILLSQELNYQEIIDQSLIKWEDWYMPDSIRLKELHQWQQEIMFSLESDKFAYADPTDPQNSDRRVTNLGYYIERIARILGINVNPDGSVRSIRQSKFVKQGDEIPAGWSIGQWGRNQGGDNEGQKGGSEDEDRDGLAYEVRSNKFAVDKFSGEATAIEQGGYVLVENLPQLLHIILSDLDKALGWAEAGANVLPNPNGEKPIPYEGLNTLLAEVAFMLSQLSRNITGTHISALKNQGMLMELIAHQGVSTVLKQIEVDIGIEYPAKLVYPALGGATNFEQSALILSNLSLLIGSILKSKEENNE